MAQPSFLCHHIRQRFIRRLHLDRNSLHNLQSPSFNRASSLSGLFDITRTRRRPSSFSISLLTIRSFVNYRRPVDADSTYRAIFAQLRAKRVRHLVLDLRENGGGSDNASAGLLRYLADAPVQPLRSVRRSTINVDPSLRPAFETWGDPAETFAPTESLFVKRADCWYAERGVEVSLPPAAESFAGHVSLLVGRHNGSGATMLLAVLQQIRARTGRLRLVGEETGGSAEGPTAGQILFLKLPKSKMRVRVPLKRSDVNVASVVKGFGVFPELDATETLADFRAGVDRALITARTTPWRSVSSPLAPTVGLMQGELEYRDYCNGRRVILPTWAHTAPIGPSGAFRVRTIYDDGPGNTIYSTDEVRVVGGRWIEGSAGEKQDTLRIVSRVRKGTDLELVLLGSGMDDNQQVDFRYTVTLGANVSRQLRSSVCRGRTGSTGMSTGSNGTLKGLRVALQSLRNRHTGSDGLCAPGLKPSYHFADDFSLHSRDTGESPHCG